MELHYSMPGVVKISMIPHVAKVIEDFPKIIMRDASLPAADHLFNVRDEPETKIPEEEAVIFHHVVTQLFFLDIDITIAFLATS